MISFPGPAKKDTGTEFIVFDDIPKNVPNSNGGRVSFSAGCRKDLDRNVSLIKRIEREYIRVGHAVADPCGSCG